MKTAFDALFVNSLGNAVWSLGLSDHLLSEILQYPVRLSLFVSPGNDSWVFAFSVINLIFVCFIFSFCLLQSLSGAVLTFCISLFLSCCPFFSISIEENIFMPLNWIFSFSSVSSTARRCLEQTTSIPHGCFYLIMVLWFCINFSCTTEHLISFDCHEDMITNILHKPVTVLKFTWSWWTINNTMICYIIYICLLLRKIYKKNTV